jgi:hypothetical protein
MKEPYIHPSLRHPTNPNLFSTSEGTYESLDYLTRVCARVECTYQVWHGSRTKGDWREAEPVIYRNMTREQAFTALVYALNIGDQQVNPLHLAYSNIHTRELPEPCHEKRKPLNKKQQYAVMRLKLAIGSIEELATKERKRSSMQRKHQLEKAHEQLRCHAPTVGIEVPQLSYFYYSEQYLKHAHQVKEQLEQRGLLEVAAVKAELAATSERETHTSFG